VFHFFASLQKKLFFCSSLGCLATPLPLSLVRHSTCVRHNPPPSRAQSETPLPSTLYGGIPAESSSTSNLERSCGHTCMNHTDSWFSCQAKRGWGSTCNPRRPITFAAHPSILIMHVCLPCVQLSTVSTVPQYLCPLTMLAMNVWATLRASLRCCVCLSFFI
jgi:hypothetical protein